MTWHGGSHHNGWFIVLYRLLKGCLDHLRLGLVGENTLGLAFRNCRTRSFQNLERVRERFSHRLQWNNSDSGPGDLVRPRSVRWFYSH